MKLSPAHVARSGLLRQLAELDSANTRVVDLPFSPEHVQAWLHATWQPEAEVVDLNVMDPVLRVCASSLKCHTNVARTNSRLRAQI